MILFLFGMLLALASCTPALAEVTNASAATDYNAVFLSLSALVAVIPLVVEIIKGFFPNLKGVWTQVVAWAVGIGLCMFGWWQQLGFLEGIEWYIALLYGLGSGLAANGLADTGLIEWMIGLFGKKKA